MSKMYIRKFMDQLVFPIERTKNFFGAKFIDAARTSVKIMCLGLKHSKAQSNLQRKNPSFCGASGTKQ